jgi:hypothetical protein
MLSISMIHCKIPDQDLKIKTSIFAHLQTLPNLNHLRLWIRRSIQFSIFRLATAMAEEQKCDPHHFTYLGNGRFRFQICLGVVDKLSRSLH